MIDRDGCQYDGAYWLPLEQTKLDQLKRHVISNQNNCKKFSTVLKYESCIKTNNVSSDSSLAINNRALMQYEKLVRTTINSIHKTYKQCNISTIVKKTFVKVRVNLDSIVVFSKKESAGITRGIR